MTWSVFSASGALKTAAASVGYGTSLPASPVDGLEYTLVDSVSTPTYTWRFRYNAGSSSAYKWEFIGGAPGAQTTTAALAVNNSTVDSSATALPKAGDWYHICTWHGSNNFASTDSTAYSYNSTTTVQFFRSSANNDRDIGGGSAWVRWLGQTSGINMKIRLTTTGNNNLGSVSHALLPIRVS